jgi:hypothetical protein
MCAHPPTSTSNSQYPSPQMRARPENRSNLSSAQIAVQKPASLPTQIVAHYSIVVYILCMYPLPNSKKYPPPLSGRGPQSTVSTAADLRNNVGSFTRYDFECPPGQVFDSSIATCNLPYALSPSDHCYQDIENLSVAVSDTGSGADHITKEGAQLHLVNH